MENKLKHIKHESKICKQCLPFSPISVWSPADKIARSGRSEQAWITFRYFFSENFSPNKILSFTVRFCIQASCGTYATEPCNESISDLSSLCFNVAEFSYVANIDSNMHQIESSLIYYVFLVALGLGKSIANKLI